MVAVWALVKPRAFALCLGFAITGPLIAGYAYAATLAVRSPWKPNSSTKVTSSGILGWEKRAGKPVLKGLTINAFEIWSDDRYGANFRRLRDASPTSQSRR